MLLFDENLAARLVAELANLYPGRIMFGSIWYLAHMPDAWDRPSKETRNE
jgi:hypothetical protein